ncbi:MAG TPA: hypothetical protein VK498_08195 [Ferruginibacter sp.]|nr:hypothetical protein [Ferruginibacter sp.]
MKKIFLTCAVAMCVFAADAQKKTTKKTKVNYQKKEAVAKAEFAKHEKERQDAIEAERVERLWADSVNKENERVANEKFEADRIAWKDTRIKQIDSTNTEKYKAQITKSEEWSKIYRNRDEVNRLAKLDAYQGKQVNYINETYHDKAQLVRDDAALTDDLKKQQLASLNIERRDKIKTAIGKSKEKKLEKKRKEYYAKNGADMEVAWINEAEGYVKQ